MSESDYYLRFSNVEGIGPKRFRTLLNFFKTAESAWHGTQSEYAQIGIKDLTYKKFSASRDRCNELHHRSDALLKKNNIAYIPQIGSNYPKSLFKLENPPIGLFAIGNTELLKNNLKIAVVGSRKVTSYGQQVTTQFVQEFVRSGQVIVSGLAMGVDAVAHASAIESKGYTVAVLGNGVDVPYPLENSQLYTRILKFDGVIISEYPPGSLPTKGSFPARNRIIAAISHSVLVPEAGVGSGSLITASFAVDLNIPVFAIPGPITSQQSQGTALLLKTGAKLALDPGDVIEDSSKLQQNHKCNPSIESLPISKEAKKVMKLLLHEPLNQDELSKKSKLAINDISRIITMLELQGYVKGAEGSKFIANV